MQNGTGCGVGIEKNRGAVDIFENNELSVSPGSNETENSYWYVLLLIGEATKLIHKFYGL